MLAVLAVTTTVGMLELRAFVMANARSRVGAAGAQVSSLLAASSRGQVTLGDSLAALPALRAYLTSPSAAARDAALRVLTFRGPGAAMVVAVELWDVEARPVLQVGGERLPPLDRAGIVRFAGTTGGSSVGLYQLMNDTIIVPLVAPIRTDGRSLGHLVTWRRIGESAAGRRALSGLVGSDATIFWGNTSGLVWTNLEHVVPAPPIASTDSGIVTYTRADSARLADVVPVAGTPLTAVVEFPLGSILQPVRDLLRRRLFIIATAVALTMLIAWAASQYIARPLKLLTERAEAMTAAGYATRIDLQREDELGRLARAFDVAAERVREDQQRLENRVRERTVELHDALEQLRSAQDMLVRKERLATLGQLSSGVGHELRNPLGVMTNAVYYLDAVAGNTSPKVKEYLGILRTQIALSERIVSDLLDFARVKQPQRQSISLAELAGQQLARVDLNGVTVQKEFAADLPRAWVDPMQTGQVVLNLITNAVQAMGSHGGVLQLRGGRDGAGRLKLEVQDTGPGIEPDLIEKIFEPLYTTKARGIGLGLAVSRALAANNDGQITVVSKPGQGATFALSLPQVPQEAAS